MTGHGVLAKLSKKVEVTSGVKIVYERIDNIKLQMLLGMEYMTKRSGALVYYADVTKMVYQYKTHYLSMQYDICYKDKYGKVDTYRFQPALDYWSWHIILLLIMFLFNLCPYIWGVLFVYIFII